VLFLDGGMLPHERRGGFAHGRTASTEARSEYSRAEEGSGIRE
jgi:hypothetical protein